MHTDTGYGETHTPSEFNKLAEEKVCHHRGQGNMMTEQWNAYENRTKANKTVRHTE